MCTVFSASFEKLSLLLRYSIDYAVAVAGLGQLGPPNGGCVSFSIFRVCKATVARRLRHSEGLIRIMQQKWNVTNDATAAHSAQADSVRGAHSDRSSGDSSRSECCTIQGELRAAVAVPKLAATSRSAASQHAGYMTLRAISFACRTQFTIGRQTKDDWYAMLIISASTTLNSTL